jgi:hypothetical protein
VCERLGLHRLYINRYQRAFARLDATLSEHVVGKFIVKVDPEKMQKLHDFPRPQVQLVHLDWFGKLSSQVYEALCSCDGIACCSSEPSCLAQENGCHTIQVFQWVSDAICFTPCAYFPLSVSHTQLLWVLLT